MRPRMRRHSFLLAWTDMTHQVTLRMLLLLFLMFNFFFLVHAGARHAYACEWNPHSVKGEGGHFYHLLVLVLLLLILFSVFWWCCYCFCWWCWCCCWCCCCSCWCCCCCCCCGSLCVIDAEPAWFISNPVLGPKKSVYYRYPFRLAVALQASSVVCFSFIFFHFHSF